MAIHIYRNGLTFVLRAIAGGAFAITLSGTNSLAWVDHYLDRAIMGMHELVSPASSSILIVQIDSIKANGTEWLIPRHYWNTIMQTVLKGMPDAVGVDVLFGGAVEPAEDEMLSKIFVVNRKVVVGALPLLGVYPRITAADEETGRVPYAYGNMALPIDEDGGIERISCDWLFPGAPDISPLSLRLLEVAAPQKRSELQEKCSSFIIPSYFRPNDYFPHISAVELLRDGIAEGSLQGKIVLVGHVSPISWIMTPNGPMSSTEMHAVIIENTIEDDWRYPSLLATVLTALIACTVLSFLCHRGYWSLGVWAFGVATVVVLRYVGVFVSAPAIGAGMLLTTSLAVTLMRLRQ